MQQNKQGTNLIRKKLVQALIVIFEKEYFGLMDNCPPAMQVELTEQLSVIFYQLIRYTNLGAMSDIFETVDFGEEYLLRKYGKRLVPYHNLNFPGYFKLETILLDRKVISAEQYKALPAGDKALWPKEAVYLANNCIAILEKARINLLLQVEPEDINGATPEETIAGAEQVPAANKAFTRSRQLLAIHYLLHTGFGLEPRSSAGVSSLARLAHLLTGTAFTNLQNSEIYKKYLKMPNYKAGNELVSDLQFIRPYFDDLGITEAVKQIDAEISRAKKEPV